jgi:hypothetical protein
MNRRKMREELLRNMDKIIDMIKREKKIKEELWINKIRVDFENDLVYFQYEGDTRVGFLVYNLIHNTDIKKLFMYDTDTQGESEINLIKGHREKGILEFRFRNKKEEGK